MQVEITLEIVVIYDFNKQKNEVWEGYDGVVRGIGEKVKGIWDLIEEKLIVIASYFFVEIKDLINELFILSQRKDLTRLEDILGLKEIVQILQDSLLGIIHKHLRLLIKMFFISIAITDNELIAELNGFKEKKVVDVDYAVSDDEKSEFGELGEIVLVEFIHRWIDLWYFVDQLSDIAELDIDEELFIAYEHSFE